MSTGMSNGFACPGLAELANGIDRRAAMPAVVRAVLEVCDSPDGDARTVARLVLTDQGLTANVLKLANSAAYGHRRRIATVSEAVVVMGLDSLKSLVFSCHAAPVLSGPLPGYAMRRGDLWSHSLRVAHLSRGLRGGGGAEAEEAFIAGLLHDVGKVALSEVLDDSFERLTAGAQNHRSSLSDGEREMVGVDHAEVGARVATIWNLPDRLIEAIGLHHRPDQAAEHPQLVACVAVADRAINAHAAGVPPDDLHYLVAPETLALTGHDATSLGELTAAVAAATDADPLTEWDR